MRSVGCSGWKRSRVGHRSSLLEGGDTEIGQRGAGQLGGQVFVREREQRVAHLAEQDHGLERAEDQHEPEARRALRIGVRELLAAREQERGEARDHVVREALLARLELRVRVVAHHEGAHQAAPLPEDRHQEVDDGFDQLGRLGALPTVWSQRGVGGGDRLLVVALVEGVEQALLVVEARVEGPDRGLRPLHDLGDGAVLEALLGHQRLGRVEDPVERLLAARLARGADPVEIGLGAGHRGSRASQPE